MLSLQELRISNVTLDMEFAAMLPAWFPALKTVSFVDWRVWLRQPALEEDEAPFKEMILSQLAAQGIRFVP